MTRGNMNSHDSNFSKASNVLEEASFGQNIELCTLKYADSPSVDDSLGEWYIHQNSSSSTATSGDPLRSGGDSGVYNGNSSSQISGNKDADCTDKSFVNDSRPSFDGCDSMDNMVFVEDDGHYIFSENQMDYNMGRENELFISENSLDCSHYSGNTMVDCDVGMAASSREASSQPQYRYPGMHQEEFQLAGAQCDRRLPDFVTIDQCYREGVQSECSTICLVANLETGDKDNEYGVEVQGLLPKRVATQQQDPSLKRERTSLRRGVMIRQMSINPTQEQEWPDPRHSYPPESGLPGVTAPNPEGWQSDQAKQSNTPSPRRQSAQNNALPTVFVEDCASSTEEPLLSGNRSNMRRESGMDSHLSAPAASSANTASPARIKMKHLGLANAAAAQRFRLTFDESSDAAANTNIELPYDVAPHGLIVKRPSCICGEPELPLEHFSKLQETESFSGFHFQDQNCPQLHNKYPTNRSIPEPLSNTAVAPTLAVSASDPDNDNHVLLDDVTDSTKQDVLTTDLSQDVTHPRVTICISNSQQSFIHLSTDSPPITVEEQAEDNVHANYNGCISRGMRNSCSRDNVSGLMSNPYAQSEEYRATDIGDSQPLLALQNDTVQAPPIQDLYRYHVFFSHCPEDREWVEHMVAHLEAPPFNYTCAYASVQDEVDQTTLHQRILCAAMLSERVVLVLSSRYVNETWFSFEKTLKQLTQMSLHNQRIMGVLLEDCDIPESLGELYFLDSSDPDFFHVFTKRLKTSRIPRSSASVSSDLGQNALAPANVTNGKILTFCRLQVKVGWDSYLTMVDEQDTDIPTSLTAHGIGMEKTEFGEIVTKVSSIVDGTNRLPWLLSARPLAALLFAGALWIPAFIAVLVIHVDDDSGIALPVRLAVFLYPLGLVAAGYLIKWRRAYWLTKIVRLLVQNCVDVNQALYFQGRPLFMTAAHVRANIFAIYFVYFDATDCVRSVDLLLFTCMEEDWDKLTRLISFYTRDKNYLSRMSISERLTVMMSAPYLVKLVRQVLPHPPQQRHVSKLLCLCQFTEECVSRFAHGFDREDVPGLAELFTRHLPGKVSGSAVRRVQEELFHASHGLIP